MPKTVEQENVDWDKIFPSAKIRKRRIGMANTKANSRMFQPPPEIQRPQARHPQNLNYQKPQSMQKSTQETQLGKYPTQTKRQWEAEMENLNSKYNFDCFSDSELDSESDEGEQYQYKHGYETLIWTDNKEFVIFLLQHECELHFQNAT